MIEVKFTEDELKTIITAAASIQSMAFLLTREQEIKLHGIVDKCETALLAQ